MGTRQHLVWTQSPFWIAGGMLVAWPGVCASFPALYANQHTSHLQYHMRWPLMPVHAYPWSPPCGVSQQLHQHAVLSAVLYLTCCSQTVCLASCQTTQAC